MSNGVTMKFFKTFLFLPFLIFSLFAFCINYAMEPAQEETYDYFKYEQTFSLDELIQNYSVKNSIKKILDQNLTSLPGPGMNHYSWLPGYVVKLDHTRLIGALFIQECIKKLGADKVATLDKRLYQTLDGVLCIVEPYIKPNDKPFSLIQTQQLYAVFKISNFKDHHSANYINTSTGIAYIIDTAQNSFTNNTDNPLSLSANLSDALLDPQAKEWLKTKDNRFQSLTLSNDTGNPKKDKKNKCVIS